MSGSSGTMHAVGFHAYGGPERISMVEVPVPRPSAGQVRIRVLASTVNPADVQFRNGDHAAYVPDALQPFCGGLEFVGHVEQLGEGVGMEVGALVAGTSHFIPGGRGSHAELVVVDAAWVAPCPSGADPVAMATVPMNALTAKVVLDELRLPAAERVVVSGAAGAVGSYFLELAASDGLEVIAIGSPSDEADLLAKGAAGFFPRGDDDVVERILAQHPNGVAAVVDAAMLDAAALPLVRPGGRFITLRPGHLPAPERGIEPRLISFRRYQDKPEMLRDLLGRATTGRLTPRVAEVFASAEGSRAYRVADTSGLRGRVVLSFER